MFNHPQASGSPSLMHVLEHVVAPGLLAIMQQQLFCKLWVSARDLQFYMSRHCRTICGFLLRHGWMDGWIYAIWLRLTLILSRDKGKRKFSAPKIYIFVARLVLRPPAKKCIKMHILNSRGGLRYLLGKHSIT